MRQDLVERAGGGDQEAFGQLAEGEVDRLHWCSGIAISRETRPGFDADPGIRPSWQRRVP